jgi:hypothetical protein
MKKKYLFRLLALLLLLIDSHQLYAASDPSNVNLAPIAGPRVFVALGGSGATSAFSFVNYGGVEVTQFHYTLTEDGTLLEEKDVVLDQPLPRMDTGTLSIHIPAGRQLGNSSLVFAITRVNGYDNRASVTSTTLTRTTVNHVAVRRVLMEDFTATWCPHCPRGTAVMEYLSHKHPEDFIGIAVHPSTDPLYCTDYAGGYYLGVRGLPTVLANRRDKVSGYTGEEQFRSEKEKGAEMDLEVAASWDEQQQNIQVTATTTFRIDNPSTPYALAYVLTASGLKGTSSGWNQNNSLSGLNHLLGISDYLDYYVKAGSVVKGVTYNDVAIMGEGINKGIAGSVATPAKADEPQIHRTTLHNIHRYPLIQDKKRLQVVVFLLNTDTKEVVNAAKCSIANAGTTGIERAESSEQTMEVARYTLDGRRVAAPVRGVNIVKYSDGTVVKQVVK